MIDEIIENITRNGVLKIAVYQNTLYIPYEGVWGAFATPEEERLLLVKPLVEKSIGERAKADLIDAVHRELKTDYYPLDNHVEHDEIYINMKDKILKIGKNGVISTQEHNAELGFLWKLNHGYNKEAKCPRFMKYLDEVIGEDDAIRVLQEYMGYIFLPHNHLNLEKALWLVGSGSNGKSVFTSLLKYIYGEDNISYLNLPELADHEKRGMLKGKILNISQDATNRVDPSSYKIIVTGENLIFRELYKGSSILKSVPKLLIATNELPMIFTGIEAFMRRVLLIPFNKVIKEEDRDLDLGEKLKEEIEGIFNFALEGLQRLLQQRHFTNSQLMNKAKMEYMGELDVLEDFLLDNPIEELSGKGVEYISQNELFKTLSSWCKDNNRKNSYSSPRKLRDKLIGKYGYSTYKNNNVYGIKGRWLSSDEMHRAINNDDYVSDDIRDIYTSDD